MYSKPGRFSTCWRGSGPEAGNDQKRGFRWTATECEAASGSAASNENSWFSATMGEKEKT